MLKSKNPIHPQKNGQISCLNAEKNGKSQRRDRKFPKKFFPAGLLFPPHTFSSELTLKCKPAPRKNTFSTENLPPPYGATPRQHCSCQQRAKQNSISTKTDSQADLNCIPYKGYEIRREAKRGCSIAIPPKKPQNKTFTSTLINLLFHFNSLIH